MEFDLELDYQVLQPGQELLGWVTLDDPDCESVEIVFAGEEILGANDIARRYILPVVDEKVSLPLEKGRGRQRKEFRFMVPPEAPPTYASRDVRCEYAVKAIVKRGFWKRSLIQRLHVTILPATQGELQALPSELEVDHPDLRLIARLDQTIVLTGESLSGSLVLEKKTENAQLPRSLSFRLACIVESTDKFYSHREVLSLDVRDVEVDPALELPLVGDFDFPIASTAPPSGTWNSFRVHYGFRVVLYDHEGKDFRRSAFIRVLRDIQERRDVPPGLGDSVEFPAPTGF
jgi:hypothetical protein